ncbi:MAG: peptidoglycan-binding protein [Clostridiales bacterium]|nr:peptidoglycan-binding protein [Clostridiales bacterium]
MNKTHLRTLVKLTVMVLIVLCAAPAVVSFADLTRVSESVNLREKPSTDAKVLKLVPMGFEVSVQGTGDVWTKVVFEGATGYIKSEFLEVVKGVAATKQDGGAGGSAASESGALRFGSEGDAVRELQTLMKEKGIYEGPVNGKFGPLTEEAVMKFQESKGLEVDGVVGSETLAKLSEKPPEPQSAHSGSYRLGDEGEAVRNIQTALTEKGFYKGPKNAKFGPLTEEAVKSFQSANGLEADGVVGKATLDLLNAKPKAAEQPAKIAAQSSSGASASGSASAPAPNGVELLDWSAAKNIFTIGVAASVYDVRTGIIYHVKSFSNGAHADVEPVTKDDTFLLLQTYGGKWSWDPRPVWVTINGHTIAASINGMPHGGGVNSANDMDGQICIHFKGSSTHNNNKAFSQLHQDAVIEAWNAARR